MSEELATRVNAIAERLSLVLEAELRRPGADFGEIMAALPYAAAFFLAGRLAPRPQKQAAIAECLEILARAVDRLAEDGEALGAITEQLATTPPPAGHLIN